MKINNMMKQAQKMQAQMLQIQEKLAQEKVEGSAGGGMVKVVVTGAGEFLEVKIDPEVIKPDEAEMLEDLVLIAMNDGVVKSKELAASRLGVMGNALGALGLDL